MAPPVGELSAKLTERATGRRSVIRSAYPHPATFPTESTISTVSRYPPKPTKATVSTKSRFHGPPTESRKQRFQRFHDTPRKARKQRFQRKQRNHDFTPPQRNHEINDFNGFTIPPEKHESNGFNESNEMPEKEAFRCFRCIWVNRDFVGNVAGADMLLMTLRLPVALSVSFADSSPTGGAKSTPVGVG